MNRFFSLFYSKTPKIKDSQGKIKAESIASSEKVKLGGVKQWILIRGHNINNPIILFLHGGPGEPETPLAYKFQREIEKRFTIINWDQRGAGKSYSKKIHKESMNVKQFISDAHELVILIRERFQKEKIILIGHSWGSILGTLLVHKYPEDFYAFVSIGQVVNLYKNIEVSFNFALEEAKKRKNKKALKKLEGLKPFNGTDLKKVRIEEKWIEKFGGMVHAFKSQLILTKMAFGSPEYSILDLIKYIRGMQFTKKAIWKDIFNYDLSSQVEEIKVPVFFCTGRFDYIAPFELAEAYFKSLKAPKKEFIWFENSAHSPNLEEYKKFDENLISKVLKDILFN